MMRAILVETHTPKPGVIVGLIAVALLSTAAGSAKAQQTDEDFLDAVRFSPGLDVLAAYELNRAQDGDPSWFHDFNLDRAHAWLGASYESVTVRVLLEAVHSTSEGALLGVAADSIVARFREAWLATDLFGWVDLRAGLVPTLAQPALERAEGLRALGMGPQERYDLLTPADLGASARLHLPAGYGQIGVGVYNGEGYRSREMNRGKNLELFARLHPAASVDALSPLTVLLAWQWGSEGPGSARADRATAELAWDTDWLGAGVSLTYLLGLDGDGAREGWLVTAHARVDLLDQLFVGARYSRFTRDIHAAPDDRLDRVQASLGWRGLEPLQLYVSVVRSLPSQAAQAALPYTDGWTFALVGRVRLGRPSP